MINAKKKVTAKKADEIPKTRPIDVASAETVAACELGMPPVPTNHLKLNLLSRITPIITFMVCAASHAKIAVKNTLFFPRAIKKFIVSPPGYPDGR